MTPLINLLCDAAQNIPSEDPFLHKLNDQFRKAPEATSNQPVLTGLDYLKNSSTKDAGPPLEIEEQASCLPP